MKRFIQYFFEGILILLPIVLTVYIANWLFTLTDSFLGKYFTSFGFHFPGLGLITALLMITLVGLLGHWFVARRLLEGLDYWLARFPVVKSIYSMVKDATHAVFGDRRSFSKVVLISLPGDDDVKLLGFLTAEDLTGLNLPDHVAVYVLQSMQWAGFLLLVPRSRLQLLDVAPDLALQFIVSAGITGNNNSH